MSHILQEVALMNMITEHGRSRGANIEIRKSPSPRCKLLC